MNLISKDSSKKINKNRKNMIPIPISILIVMIMINKMNMKIQKIMFRKAELAPNVC